MTKGLHRYQQAGDLHFITFSCYQRRPDFDRVSTRDLFESARAGKDAYTSLVCGHRLRRHAEHVHILMNEPKVGTVAGAIQALKLSVAVRERESPFWQSRYYDFNVFSSFPPSGREICGICTAIPSPAV